jgi:putative transcriptional regulator
MSKLGKRLIASVRKTRANLQAGHTLKVHVPADVDAKKIRQSLHLSQTVFAARYGIPEGTLRDWEQHRRKPEGPARAYLMVIARNPEAVRRALEPA